VKGVELQSTWQGRALHPSCGPVRSGPGNDQ